eukprot:TRINITY_DN44956_c0_g1_i1.p1 TRINITY_DN44956_c0_g1~~TRINITY_DN44956_c0_g1_i1.p1  ORF type:complete len:1064 (-),score=208.88 TRINITY_DN44956_c0_g1_i1:9-3200(-)
MARGRWLSACSLAVLSSTVLLPGSLAARPAALEVDGCAEGLRSGVDCIGDRAKLQEGSQAHEPSLLQASAALPLLATDQSQEILHDPPEFSTKSKRGFCSWTNVNAKSEARVLATETRARQAREHLAQVMLKLSPGLCLSGKWNCEESSICDLPGQPVVCDDARAPFAFTLRGDDDVMEVVKIEDVSNISYVDASGHANRWFIEDGKLYWEVTTNIPLHGVKKREADFVRFVAYGSRGRNYLEVNDADRKVRATKHSLHAKDVGRLLGQLRTLASQAGVRTDIEDLELVWNPDSNNGEMEMPRDLLRVDTLAWIEMTNGLLKGLILPGLFDLPELAHVDLHSNRLEGRIPDTIGKAGSGLQWLDLSCNELVGPLPDGVGKLTNLFALDLSHNKIGGRIAPATRSLANMKIFGCRNCSLTGSIPNWIRDWKQVRVLDLAQNKLTGPIPTDIVQLPQLRGILLFDNKLNGILPADLAEIKTLAWLAVHSNEFHGVVPKIQFTKTRGYNKDIILTLFGNHLSGVIPTPVIPNVGQDRFLAAVALGNKFSMTSRKDAIQKPLWGDEDKPPAWLPNKMQDPIHFISPQRVMPSILVAVVGLSMWLLLVIYKVNAPLGTILIELKGEETAVQDVSTRHVLIGQSLLFRAMIMALAPLSLFGLLPAYWMGSNYFQEGRWLSHFSIAYMYRAPGPMAICGTFWAIYLFAVVGLHNSLWRPKEKISKWMLAYRCVAWVGWLAVLMVFGIIPGFYAMIKTLPTDNWLTEYVPFQIRFSNLVILLPFVNALSYSFFMVAAATHYARWTGLKLARLLASAHVVCMWIVPAVVVALCSEHCAQNWRKFWNVCGTPHNGFQPSAEFDLSLANPCNIKQTEILSTELLCKTPSWHDFFWVRGGRGGCSRELVEILSPLVLQQTAIEAAGFPLIYLLLWLAAVREEDGTLRAFGCRVSFTREDYLAQLDIWTGTAVLWGPLVPLVLPILALAVAVNYCMTWIEASIFKSKVREEEDASDGSSDEDGMAMRKIITEFSLSRLVSCQTPAHISQDFVKCSLVLLMVYLIVFVYETQMVSMA